MKSFGKILLLLLVALPVAGVLTFLLWPFWGWFEERTGIESLGHSGPADWCFWFAYGVVVAIGLGLWFLLRTKRPPPH